MLLNGDTIQVIEAHIWKTVRPVFHYRQGQFLLPLRLDDIVKKFFVNELRFSIFREIVEKQEFKCVVNNSANDIDACLFVNAIVLNLSDLP